jgi:hypothetical protein
MCLESLYEPEHKATMKAALAKIERLIKRQYQNLMAMGFSSEEPDSSEEPNNHENSITKKETTSQAGTTTPSGSKVDFSTTESTYTPEQDDKAFLDVHRPIDDATLERSSKQLAASLGLEIRPPIETLKAMREFVRFFGPSFKL